MKCDFCSNYMTELKQCKFCHFEFDEAYDYYKSDDWNILDLPEKFGWEHIQIRDRLWLMGIECLFADIWMDGLAIICGANVDDSKLADALNVHTEVIYNDWEHGWTIINLFQEKYLRGELD